MKTGEKPYRFLSRILELLFLGMVFFLPISKAALEILFTLALLVFAAKKIYSRESIVIPCRCLMWLGAFATFCTLSLAVTPDFSLSFKALFFKWGEYLLLFLIISDSLRPKTNRSKTIVYLFLSMVFLIACDGIFQRNFGYDIFQHQPLRISSGNLKAMTGPFEHNNMFGTFLGAGLIMGLAFFIKPTENPVKKRIIWGIFISVCAVGLLGSLSRGAWLGFFAALCLMMFLAPTKKIFLGILGFLVLLFLVGQPFRDRLLFTLQPHGDADRLIFWKSAWQMICENPLLGHGIGTFMRLFPKYAPLVYVHYAHNTFLQIWAETGLLSLASFIIFLWSVFWTAIKTIKHNFDPFVLGVLCALFGFVVHSTMDVHFYSLQLSFFFWLFLGLLHARIHEGVTFTKLAS